jgi:hypothetical protein
MARGREHRYLLDRLETRILLARLRPFVKERLYDPERPFSFVQTTYVDTLDHDYLHSHREGMARSLRIRRYVAARERQGALEPASPCFLELKETCGIRRRKWRVPVRPTMLPRVLDGSVELEEALEPSTASRDAILALTRELRLGPLRPTITTWCHRRTYSADQRNVHITIDQDVSWCHAAEDDLRGTDLALARVFRRSAADVIEVKCRHDRPMWLIDAFAELNETRAFTKYRAGMGLSRRARMAA